jgi:hypothetical protein
MENPILKNIKNYFSPLLLLFYFYCPKSLSHAFVSIILVVFANFGAISESTLVVSVFLGVSDCGDEIDDIRLLLLVDAFIISLLILVSPVIGANF